MRAAWLSLALLAAALAAAPVAAQCPLVTPVQGAPPPGPLPVFPADNWWNLDISDAPVDPASDAYITWIGPTKGMHPDFGGVDTGDYVYGIPYAVVNGDNETKQAVTFEVWDESDGVDMDTGDGIPFYPIPVEAIDQAHWIEGGPAGTVDIRGDNDRHLLIVDCQNRHLYELYNVWYDDVAEQWHAYSGAFFDLDTNDRRPDTWTSADASGMAVFPGLVRYDEAADITQDDLGHAIRMTTRDTNGYVFPASHDAGNGTGAPPLGARLRLKMLDDEGLDPVLRTDDPIARRILRTMQKYGLIIADNGSDMYFTGTFDTRWDNGELNPAFDAIEAQDFEVIQLGWNPSPITATLSIADTNLAEGDAGTRTATFTVTLSHAETLPVTFDIATANGTASAGSDYVAKALTGQTIAAGQTSKTFTVVVNGDTAVEANETLFANLTNANATVTDAQGRANILNDDGATLSVADVAVAEGNAGTKALTFVVRLSQVAAAPVTFNIATSNGTATAGSDYVAKSATAQTIAAGSLTRGFAVTLNGDTGFEQNETFKVTLSAPSGATIFDATATGTLVNDDGGRLSINNVGVAEGNSGTKVVTFTVSLAQAIASNVTYDIATANGTATAGSDYVARTLTGQVLTAGQTSKTFTVTLNGDTTREANETVLVNLSAPVNATLLDGQGRLNILNDDGPRLSITDASVSEGNAGTKTLNFTVNLSQAATGPVSYDIDTANGTATAGSDYVAKALASETIAAGMLSKAFAVTVNGDTAVEGNETLTVTLRRSYGASIYDAAGTGTITNDD